MPLLNKAQNPLAKGCQNKKLTIVLTGGGSAGHLFPLQPVVESLRGKRKNIHFVLFAPKGELEKKTAREINASYQRIISGKFRRYLNLGSIFLNIFDFFKFIAGYFQALFSLIRVDPDVIFSKGGYASLPTTLAAATIGIPIVQHESDLMPGLANRMTARFCRRIATAFPTSSYKMPLRFKSFYAGLPLKEDFTKGRELQKRYILVFGGSSGAVSLNSLIFELARPLLVKHKIVHLTGHIDFERATEFKKTLSKDLQKNYRPIAFSDDVADLIADAKLIISRAGATSIFEIASMNKPAIFVPIPKSVTIHQQINAEYLRENNLAEVYFHSESKEQFVKKINRLLAGETNFNLSSFYLPQSAEIVSRAILDEIELEELEKIKTIFLIGIKGVSMSLLAKILKRLGKNVEGSDLKLEGHSRDNITPDIDLVVYSSAADMSSPARVEHEAAHAMKIPVLKRSQMIGALMAAKTGISVSGMHGKTSISSLAARVLEKVDPRTSYLIGSNDTPINRTANYGRGEYFITEACEYDSSFLDFPTTIGIISNIEEEHLDYFRSGLPQIKETFGKFIQNIRPGGVLIYCMDDKNVQAVVSKNRAQIEDKKIKMISYGFLPSSNICVASFKVEAGRSRFSYKIGERKIELKSQITGKHFALNLAAVAALAKYLGIPEEILKKVALNYRGAARRFELLGIRNGVTILDDYAHHPTEISATLEALSQKYPRGRRFIIFQPHQQNRMNLLFEKFTRAFSTSKYHQLILLPVYRVAGRDEKEWHSSFELAENLQKRNIEAVYFEDYEETVEYLKANLRSGDVLMTMGATDVYKIAEGILKNGLD